MERLGHPVRLHGLLGRLAPDRPLARLELVFAAHVGHGAFGKAFLDCLDFQGGDEGVGAAVFGLVGFDTDSNINLVAVDHFQFLDERVGGLHLQRRFILHLTLPHARLDRLDRGRPNSTLALLLVVDVLRIRDPDLVLVQTVLYI